MPRRILGMFWGLDGSPELDDVAVRYCRIVVGDMESSKYCESEMSADVRVEEDKVDNADAS
jgi:hypothetical protein